MAASACAAAAGCAVARCAAPLRLSSGVQPPLAALLPMTRRSGKNRAKSLHQHAAALATQELLAHGDPEAADVVSAASPAATAALPTNAAPSPAHAAASCGAPADLGAAACLSTLPVRGPESLLQAPGIVLEMAEMASAPLPHTARSTSESTQPSDSTRLGASVGASSSSQDCNEGGSRATNRAIEPHLREGGKPARSRDRRRSKAVPTPAQPRDDGLFLPPLGRELTLADLPHAWSRSQRRENFCRALALLSQLRSFDLYELDREQRKLVREQLFHSAVPLARDYDTDEDCWCYDDEGPAQVTACVGVRSGQPHRHRRVSLQLHAERRRVIDDDAAFECMTRYNEWVCSYSDSELIRFACERHLMRVLQDRITKHLHDDDCFGSLPPEEGDVTWSDDEMRQLQAQAIDDFDNDFVDEDYYDEGIPSGDDDD